MQNMQVGQASINELYSSKQINYFIIIYRNVRLYSYSSDLSLFDQPMNKTSYSIF